MTAAVLCFVLFLAGCGGMEEGAQASCPFLWYEKHVEEGKQYSIVAVTKDETYGCYYKNHRLTAVFTDKEGIQTVKRACLPKQYEVKNLGVDRKGNIYVLCGNRKEEGRVLWEVDEKGILKEKGRDILLSEEEKFIDIKGVKIEQGGGVYIW